jgi:phenylacetate-CoA ligase
MTRSPQAAQPRASVSGRFRRLFLAAKHVRYTGQSARALRVDNDLDATELREMSWARRLSLVRHCWSHVPYYQHLFRRIGFHPNDLTDETVFAQLPILEKDDIRENMQRLLAENVPARFRRASATGGSTGQPLKVYLDSRFPNHSLASRMLHWWGVDPSDNSGYLYRAVPEGVKRVATSIALYPTRRVYLHSASMTPARMRKFYQDLIRLKVSYLVGYVGGIDAFGEFLAAEKQSIPTLKAIWTTAAPLPRFKQRLLDTIYGCRVFTQYGCVETPFLAAECQCRCGLHIFSDIRHLEVLPGEGDQSTAEEVGDILVTDLTNYVFPLLRYRVGDRGRLLPGSCECGRPYPLMDYVQGRVTDNIYLADGSVIPGEYWTTIFDDWPDAVKAFQVQQSADYSVVIRYEPGARNTETAVRSVRQVLESRTQGQLNIEFCQGSVCVNDNGKTRYVVSEAKRRVSASR